MASDYCRPYPVTPATNSAVVISGCSSGIGLHTALYLADKGFHVYAGVRRASDFDAFESYSLVTPTILDVTNTKSVQEAVRFIEHDLTAKYNGDVELTAVVNNAGIGYLSAVQELELTYFRTLMDINVVGAVDMIKQFLPLLQKHAAAGGGSRIVSVGSVSGFLSTPLMGAYGASKFAMEALSDSLRAEMDMFNISVSLIEPGTISGTKIRSKRIRDEVSAEIEGEMGVAREEKETHHSEAMAPIPTLATVGSDSAYYGRFYASTRERLRLADESGVADPPSVVAEAIYHALSSPYPRPRYLVGRVGKIPAWMVDLLKRVMPTRLVDKAILELMMKA